MITKASSIGKFSVHQKAEIKKNIERIERAIKESKVPQSGITAYTGCDDDVVIAEIIRRYKEAGWIITHTKPEPMRGISSGHFWLRNK